MIEKLANSNNFVCFIQTFTGHFVKALLLSEHGEKTKSERIINRLLNTKIKRTVSTKTASGDSAVNIDSSNAKQQSQEITEHSLSDHMIALYKQVSKQHNLTPSANEE